jgi:2-keto-4-pentenoate hydratase/2-oxohepta-3-ene-1,7-dioic acid hydratase in catechol pathway
MKILCVGRNYAAHAREMQSELPQKPVVFLKPDTALLQENKPFYYPDFSNEIHYECEIVLRIGKPGKYIAERFVWDHIDGIGLGVDMTARDLQRDCKEKGLPWEIAKAFNDAAPVSQLFPPSTLPDWQHLSLTFYQNETQRQQGFTRDMIFPPEQLIAYLSQFFQLKTGDLVFTGAPEGVGPVYRGDQLRGWLGEHLLLDFFVA